MLSISIIDGDIELKDAWINSLCVGDTKTSDFYDLLDYVFKTGNLLDDICEVDLFDDDSLIYFLSSLRMLYRKFFINPPTILCGNMLRYYKLLFDIDDYMMYIKLSLPIVKDSLIFFKNLDVGAEVFSLLVDNYCSEKFNKAYSDDYEIQLKILDRMNKIDKVLWFENKKWFHIK